jgi:hypothetical protein
MEAIERQLPCFLQAYCICGKWGSESTNAKPQSKFGAFDNTSHDPWARQSLCKCLCSCNWSSRRKPYKGGPHLHYNWPYLWKWRCLSLQRPYDKRSYNDNSLRARRGWKSWCHYTTMIWRWFTMDEQASTFLRSFTIPTTFPRQGGRVVWKFVAIEQSKQSTHKGLNGSLLCTKNAL